MVTSALERPWLIALAVVALLAVAVFGYLTRTGPQRPEGVRWVANASYLTQLASFRSRLARHRVGLAAVAAVREAGLPAHVSNTAGTYVCNAVFYAARHRIAEAGSGVRAGFVHVPYSADQPGAAAAPSMPIEDIAAAP